MALTDKLSAIGVAIREKTGKSELLTLDAMPTEIASITTGGGSEDCNGLHIPEEALIITGDCSYRFANNSWNWFIEECGNQITTNNITNASFMFFNVKGLDNISFDINCNNNSVDTQNMYVHSSLKTLPKIFNITPINLTSFCNDCQQLREIPEDYFDTWDWSKIDSQTGAYGDGKMSYMFSGCKSLRSIPQDLFAQNHINKYMSPSYVVYSGGFNGCNVIENIKLPVYDKVNWTSNAFPSYGWANLYRLTSLTFNTNEDGTPIVVSGTWKSQTFDMSNYFGYAPVPNEIISFNSGITADKEVKDDATYQALKNDPDWFTTKPEYSRFNHNSAVELINSLPDVRSGSSNTIKFRGNSGSLTDGGAINTLTEEEIAVATAKGWTVSLV
jgi:hypothetical protein